MTHPLTTQEFKEKLEDLISNNPKIKNPKVIADLKNKLNFVSEKHPSKPGKPNLQGIKSVTEVAFQRGIYNGATTNLIENLLDDDKIINWIDLELPVVLSKNRRRFCIDIIGSTKDKLVLCELKFNKLGANPSDNPMYAIFELLIYYHFVRNNFKDLDELKIFHNLPSNKNFNWEKYLKNSVPLLLVTANASYWKYWLNRKNYKTELLKEVSVLEKELHIEIQLYETDDEDFLEQKKMGDNESYSPKVASNIWTKLCN